MLSFYDQKGPNSWAENIVPNVITSNPFIAKCYAKVNHLIYSLFKFDFCASQYEIFKYLQAVARVHPRYSE